MLGCPEGGDGADACQMFQTWCEETETCMWSWEECGDPVLDPKPVPVPLSPTAKPTLAPVESTPKPTTKKPTSAPVPAPSAKPTLTAEPTSLPTTAAPSTTASPMAMPATAAPVASSPLGGDGVGDHDHNDDPSTDAAAARGTVVAAFIALFYAL